MNKAPLIPENERAIQYGIALFSKAQYAYVKEWASDNSSELDPDNHAWVLRAFVEDHRRLTLLLENSVVAPASPPRIRTVTSGSIKDQLAVIARTGNPGSRYTVEASSEEEALHAARNMANFLRQYGLTAKDVRNPFWSGDKYVIDFRLSNKHSKTK